MSLANKTLKQGNFKSAQSPNAIIPRYIIENPKDLSEFGKAFRLSRNQKVSFKQYLSDGLTIILTDANITGFHSYCFESKVKENQHPSDFIRIV